MNAFLLSHRVNDTKKATHLSLVGGAYSIRKPEDVDAFYSLYVQTPNRYFFVERVCYPSFFFMDLDHCPLNIVSVKNTLRDTGFSQVHLFTNKQGGYHIVFKTIVVRSPADAVKQCERICEYCPSLNLYADHSVYTSGLRMIGSKKSRDVGRIYYPAENSRVITKNDVHRSSIHYQIQTSKPWSRLSSAVSAKSKIQPNLQLNFQNIHPRYASIGIKSVKYDDPVVCVISDSTFCPNINEEHRSANAYFCINLKTKKVIQKCLCKCSTTGCSNYYGKPVVVLARTYSYIHSLL